MTNTDSPKTEEQWQQLFHEERVRLLVFMYPLRVVCDGMDHEKNTISFENEHITSHQNASPLEVAKTLSFDVRNYASHLEIEVDWWKALVEQQQERLDRQGKVYTTQEFIADMRLFCRSHGFILKRWWSAESRSSAHQHSIIYSRHGQMVS